MGLRPEQYLPLLMKSKQRERKPQTTIEPDEGPESDLHEKIIAECQRRMWVCIHNRMDRKATNQCGTPDFIIAGNWPSSQHLYIDKRIWFIECKSRTGKLSPAQNAMKFHLEKLGHAYHVVRSFEEFLEVVK